MAGRETDGYRQTFLSAAGAAQKASQSAKASWAPVTEWEKPIRYIFNTYGHGNLISVTIAKIPVTVLFSDVFRGPGQLYNNISGEGATRREFAHGHESLHLHDFVNKDNTRLPIEEFCKTLQFT